VRPCHYNDLRDQMLHDGADSELESTITVVQEVQPPFIPNDAHVMTVLITHPPGDPGYPPHRLPSGPAFGYMIEGEMLFEREGEAPRVVRAGDAFWGPGGDVIHYRDANNRADIPCSFVLTMLRAPGQPMLEPVTDAELEARKELRVTQTGASAVSTGEGSRNERMDEWREATHEMVLFAASAIAAADQPQLGASISITVTGNALSNDLVLADTGNIALKSLGDHARTHTHPMSVVPMRLDILSDLPAIRVLGHGMTQPAQLQLVLELTARNPHNGTASVMTCGFDSVRLDPQTPLALLDFDLQHVEPRH
jgi:quercetin dioxygenase-like cupin family protein